MDERNVDDVNGFKIMARLRLKDGTLHVETVRVTIWDGQLEFRCDDGFSLTVPVDSKELDRMCADQPNPPLAPKQAIAVALMARQWFHNNRIGLGHEAAGERN